MSLDWNAAADRKFALSQVTAIRVFGVGCLDIMLLGRSCGLIAANVSR